MKTKIFFCTCGVLILGLLSWATGEDDPVDIVWAGFWIVASAVGSFAIILFFTAILREWWGRRTR